MNLNKIHLYNFRTYKEEKIDFTSFKTNKVLVLGINKDEEGSDNNGSGKSTLFDSVIWALSGYTPLRGKTSADSVIGSFDSTCFVEVEFSGRFNLRVKRTRAKKAKLEFWVNNESKHTMGDTTKTQDTLLMYLGVPKDFHNNWFEDFMSTRYFSSEIAEVFTSNTSTPSQRFSFVSRYLNLRTLDLCTENAKLKSKKIDGQLLDIRSRYNLIDERIKGFDSIEVLKGQIKTNESIIKQKELELENLEKEFDKIQKNSKLEQEISQIYYKTKDKTESMSKRIKELKVDYDRKEKEYESYEQMSKDLEQVSDELSKIKIDEIYEKLTKETERLNKAKEELSTLTRDKKEKEDELKHLEEALSGSITCPECGTYLSIQHNKVEKLNEETITLSVSKAKLEIVDIEKSINKNLSIESETTQLTQDLNNDINQYNILKNKFDISKSKLENKEQLIEEINNIIDLKDKYEKETQEAINLLTKELNKLKEEQALLGNVKTMNQYKEENKKVSEAISDAKGQIDRLTFTISKIEEEIEQKKVIEESMEEKEKELEAFKFAETGFPTIRKWRIDNFIPSFENESNHFLNVLKSRIKITLDTEKESKKGTIKDTFPMEAIDPEGNKRGLETFSKGEKARVSLAIAWALKVLKENTNYLPFSFTLMDEIADGLDETGIKYLSHLADTSEEQFYIVSHYNTFKDLFSEKIIITKENGQSTINMEYIS